MSAATLTSAIEKNNFRAVTIRSKWRNEKIYPPIMIKNYMAIALRNLRQNPLYSFINILSLAIGLSACLIIHLFISDEKSFDAFHSKVDHLYRLDEVQNFPGTNEQRVALSMPGMGPALKRDFPEVKSYCRFWSNGEQLVSKGDEKLIIEKIFVADSTLFDLFDFPLLQGDPATCLDQPKTILLTEKSALKFFKSVDEAMNNTITWREKEYKIMGVLKNLPENSHLQCDAIASMVTFSSEQKDFNDRWGSNWMNTYLLLNDNANTGAMESKFPAFLSRHMSDPKINDFYKMFLQSLSNVHLGSTNIEHDYNNYRKFNGSYLNVFYMIGAFILLIAAVNFMNLTTARASHRWLSLYCWRCSH